MPQGFLARPVRSSWWLRTLLGEPSHPPTRGDYLNSQFQGSIDSTSY